MRTILIAAMLVLTVGTQVPAEPLDQNRGSAEAKWLVHVDFDALRAAKTAQRIGSVWLGRDSSQRHLEQIRETIGMDPTRDVRSVTFYGSRFEHLTGVVIVRAKVDQQRLSGYVKKLVDYRMSPHGNHELHAWTRFKGKKHEHTVTGCFHGPDLIVLGREAAEVKAALDVLDGKSAGLAANSPLLAAKAPPGTVVRAAASGMANADVLLKSPILKQSESFSLVVGEHEGKVFARAALAAQSPEVAGQLRQIVDGFLAMARMLHREDPDAMKILRAVQVTTDGKTIGLEWDGAAEDVLELMEKALSRASGPRGNGGRE